MRDSRKGIMQQEAHESPPLLAFRAAPVWSSYSLHVVGWKHARIAGPFNRAIHPTVINLLHIDDGVAILKRDFILVSCIVIVDCAEPLLGNREREDSNNGSVLREAKGVEGRRKDFVLAVKFYLIVSLGPYIQTFRNVWLCRVQQLGMWEMAMTKWHPWNLAKLNEVFTVLRAPSCFICIGP